jgi:hypothetical protein
MGNIKEKTVKAEAIHCPERDYKRENGKSRSNSLPEWGT